MKILVADDDRIARKVLRAFLEDASYQVVLAEDGKQAVELLMAADAPPIVILDWVMPGMSGPEVCAKLRVARLRFRPYVLMLSAKNDKNEVVAGLDAGADDFLSKPFNLAELLARLRVAQRMVEYELDLHKKIAELEALEQRHHLLGELIAHTPVGGGHAENNAAAEPPPPPPAEPVPPQPLLPADQIASLASAALEQLGLGEVHAVEPAPGYTPPRETYSAWVSLIATDQKRWFDLVLEAEPDVVASLLEKTLNRSAAGSTSKKAFLAEALTIVSSALRSELRQRACETLMPYLSRGMRLDHVRQRLPLAEDTLQLHLDLAGHAVRLTVVEQPAPFKLKTSPQLRLNDVLAEAYPPPRVHEVPLLNRGAILNERYIEKISAFAEATSEQHPIPVFSATPLAAFFNHEDEY
ncbi:MAG: response regulator transcription factor [Opitutaceae bacterium]|nr:response regulator transcription factor [Opitutaceae bacterium]